MSTGACFVFAQIWSHSGPQDARGHTTKRGVRESLGAPIAAETILVFRSIHTLGSSSPRPTDSLVFSEDDGAWGLVPWEDMIEITQVFGLDRWDMPAAMGQLREKPMGFDCAGSISRAGVSGSWRYQSRRPGLHAHAGRTLGQQDSEALDSRGARP